MDNLWITQSHTVCVVPYMVAVSGAMYTLMIYTLCAVCCACTHFPSRVVNIMAVIGR